MTVIAEDLKLQLAQLPAWFVTSIPTRSSRAGGLVWRRIRASHEARSNH